MIARLFKYRLILPIFIILSLLTGCQGNPSADEAFTSFTEKCFEEYVTADAITLHFRLSEPKAAGISIPDSPSFGDFSISAQKESCTRAAELLKELEQFDPEELSDENRRTYDIFHAALKDTAASEKFLLYPSLLGTNGMQSQIPVTLSEYYFSREEDVKTYLALVSQIPELFEQIIAFEKERERAGFPHPDFIIENTLEQINTFLQGSEESNLLVESFETKINQLSSLSNDQKSTYIINNRALIRQVVMPAFEHLRDTLEQWETDSSGAEHLCQQDGGREYYRWLLSSQVGTSMSPEECIKAMEKQLQAAVRDVTELSEEQPDIYTDYLISSPVLKDANVILRELESDTFIDFPEIPEISYDLKNVPDALASTSAAAFYFLPPIDTENQNVIYINDRRVDERTLFSTLAHEGYPGHLYQTNYFMNTNDEPLRHLLLCNGWDEGWATYAQLHSYNYLEFEDTDRETASLLRQIYRNNDVISITLSSLSDLYVNYGNYTLKQLQDFLSIYGVEDEAARNIYEYVVENPAGYLSYSIGCYELEKLKTEVSDKLGEDFDIQEFHRAVLEAGSCPFSILKEQVYALLIS